MGAWGLGSAQAATLLQKRITHRVQPDGSVLESTALQVHLDNSADVDEWSAYSIYLDDHRSLVDIETYAVTPDGERVVVKKKMHDTIESPGRGTLADSSSFRLVEFPNLPTGSVLHISHTVRDEPYFPAGSIALGSDDDIASLEVEISGSPNLRFHLDGQAEGWGPESFRVEERPGSLRVVGEGLPAVDPPSLAPGDADLGPVVRYTWDGQGTWDGVASWYQGLLSGLATTPEVMAQARRLTEGRATTRAKVDALLSYASETVRYVAVEMGIGGFQPSPPSETLSRGWGDCKDKAFLLVSMLDAVGIEAHPALILAARDRKIDRDLPSPGQFNHAIVAVPLDGQDLEVEEGDPVAGGYLFLDPTDDEGSSRWLHASVQDQDTLVVAGQRSALVRTPLLSHLDVRELTVDLTLEPTGEAHGYATLAFRGRHGDFFRRGLAALPSEQAEARVRSVLGRVLPGVELSGVTWEEETGKGAPEMTLAAQVQLLGLVQGSRGRVSLWVPGLSGAPDLDDLDDRKLPVVLTPGGVHETWSLRLPEGVCLDDPRTWEADNELGSFAQTVTGGGLDGSEPPRLTVSRRLDLHRRWVEPGEVPQLRELALAEIRALKRRIRLGACQRSAR